MIHLFAAVVLAQASSIITSSAAHAGIIFFPLFTDTVHSSYEYLPSEVCKTLLR
jgi:hypothetical protein